MFIQVSRGSKEQYTIEEGRPLFCVSLPAASVCPSVQHSQWKAAAVLFTYYICLHSGALLVIENGNQRIDLLRKEKRACIYLFSRYLVLSGNFPFTIAFLGESE